MGIEFGERIARIPAYPLAAAYNLGDDVAMLASNESPFTPHPDAIAAAHEALAGVHRYPDPAYQPLRQALADRYGVARQRIVLGNGSCDILLCAGEALLEPGAELVYAWPAFSVYPHLPAASGARAIEVPLDDEDRHDLDAMAAEITVSTRLVIVCNPNNPTGTSLSLEEIEAFLAKVPRHCAVILDEAYAEFALVLGDTYASIDLLARHPNLMILRTFSKAYGLAGLRVGYGLCGSEELRQAIDQVRQPGARSSGRGRAAGRPHGRITNRDQRGPARARALGRRLRRELHLDAPAEPRGGGRGAGGAARPGRDRPRRVGAGAGRRAAGDDRDRRREPPLSRGDGRSRGVRAR
jgi:histidinol-phosphate aminotransferase